MTGETEPSERAETNSPAQSPETTAALRQMVADTNESREAEPHGDWQTRIILQRHTDYDNRFPEEWSSPTAEEAQTLGRLTPEGVANSQAATKERVEEALREGGPDTDFLVIASPTFWVDRPEFGQRAIETGEVISDEILRQLKDAGLGEEHLLNTTDSFKSREGSDYHGKHVRPKKQLVESQMFQDPAFADIVREEFGGKQNREFWDKYNADPPDRKALREANPIDGKPAEGSPEAAERMNFVVNAAERYAEAYHRKNPGRKLVIFLVSHHEAIEPYVQRALRVPPKVFEPDKNQGVTIDVDAQGVGHTNVAGEDIDVEFTRHGRPPKLAPLDTELE